MNGRVGKSWDCWLVVPGLTISVEVFPATLHRCWCTYLSTSMTWSRKCSLPHQVRCSKTRWLTKADESRVTSMSVPLWDSCLRVLLKHRVLTWHKNVTHDMLWHLKNKFIEFIDYFRWSWVRVWAWVHRLLSVVVGSNMKIVTWTWYARLLNLEFIFCIREVQGRLWPDPWKEPCTSSWDKVHAQVAEHTSQYVCSKSLAGFANILVVVVYAHNMPKQWMLLIVWTWSCFEKVPFRVTSRGMRTTHACTARTHICG